MGLRRDRTNGLICALLLAGCSLSASANTNREVPRVKAPIQLDGQIRPEEWQEVPELPLSWEIDPQRGTATNWVSTARVTHDGRTLLLAIDARDDMAERIVAPRGARDTVGNEDFVAVQIDAEGNHQRHFNFFINAAGVIGDNIDSDTGAGSPQWSGAWEAVVQRSEQGYTVEVAIPLATLNAHSKDGAISLAINILRHVGRDRREMLAIAPLDLSQNCQECQYDVFALQEVEGDRMSLEARPYVAARQSRYHPPGTPDDTSTDSDIGIDLLWQIGNGRKMVATINPDFSELEPDQIQFSINRRYAITFTENRPFFTENAAQFNAQIPLVYTRSIVDPSAALAYGSTSTRWGIYGILADDRETDFVLPGEDGSRTVRLDLHSQTLLARVQRNGERGSRLGAMFTGRMASGYENLVLALDGRKVFNERHTLDAILVGSTADADADLAALHNLPEHETGGAARVVYNYSNGNVGSTSILASSTEGFRADAGQLNRTGNMFMHHEWYWNVPRPAGSRISKFGGGLWGNYTDVYDSNSSEGHLEAWGYMNLSDGSGMDGFMHVGRETFRDYTFNTWITGFGYGWQINEKARVWAGPRFYHQIDYYALESTDGWFFNVGFNYRPVEKWSFNGYANTDRSRGEVTRDFAINSAYLRANWSPRLGHTVSLVANWGGTEQDLKTTMLPIQKHDSYRTQLVYLYQRKDRSSFHIGVNLGGEGIDGPFSMKATDELFFAKIIIDFDWGD